MKILSFLLLLFCCGSALGQLSQVATAPFKEIGKAKSGLVFIASISYVVMESDTTFRLAYTDVGRAFSGLQSITFKNVDNALDQLYITIKTPLGLIIILSSI
ncbi:hypothetical protein [Paraflavitalea speifideaquila]|uniref:hypothetical protein n=1 Tax=Paraflavitalea speifideaquila TaxID=3076558 RepID=UPI0028E475E1|nr:hypothetical protein [Paraflavitalea speifideiaquila]